MNAVEIEQAVSDLAGQPFDGEEFPFAFLTAFGNKDATIRRLRTGGYNKSDLGGVLQTNNIHIKVCPTGTVGETLRALKASPATTRAKAKFILATDGHDFQAENLIEGETVACDYKDFPDHFGFFLALAGITTVRQIRESAFDIKATGRLNRLYVELLKDNPDWGMAARRPDMNHFMARLIFCFFAEDTDIFPKPDLFTDTVAQMSARDSSDTHQVIGELFRAMNTKIADRDAAGIPRWANQFPYVNGGLFSDSVDVPRFSRIARTYLIHIGNLDWKKINPDIFGSMIQAVAEDEERGALGMHYTSVPNILKVLNPLFLDDLRAKLAEAGDNSRMLLNLRRRMARIRVFDPACGSGNFLVIAYKEMRKIEAEINKRRSESDRRSEIPLTNFRGIELRDFPAEIARLALIIAEYQCDVLYRGQKEALKEFLPLDAMNWIICGNALRLDWLSVCPPGGTGVKLNADDLFHTPLDQAQIDFENEGGETYICGNPPYLGYNRQSSNQKSDLEAIFSFRTKNWRSLDYISGWFGKYLDIAHRGFDAAFVSTNSICQGEHAAILWSMIFGAEVEIFFAVPNFRWANNASNNAVVTVSVIGLTSKSGGEKCIYLDGHKKSVKRINQYLIEGEPVPMAAASRPISKLPQMLLGNMPKDGGNLILSRDEAAALRAEHPSASDFLCGFYGSQELINGSLRYCIWINDDFVEAAKAIPQIRSRLKAVAEMRLASPAKSTRDFATRSHRFKQIQGVATNHTVAVPSVSSERREYLPVDILPSRNIVSSLAFALYDVPLWNMALIASRLHLVWIATVCGKLETRYRYSNTLGWNTFPVPSMTEKNRLDLTRCAEDILLARQAHFPATIADLYDPDDMPINLREAHDRNDEVLERIYIGRRFRNDTERLEKLFELYNRLRSDSVAKDKQKSEASA
ncbi:class I SAM-dependent DNA methyltransferase [Roseomonas sp. SSH11]|uniref:site-specific DNA-methyltransferase (adenine-specific) n=1 Tax=Pararoseomonas baculiformis TaxID=2820812 RepID=A0ABS4AJS3_9PROT|nr:class I SAM-dependent DNA methyltransferase [Pararoseomonas baculiformis]MBP0447273.1 class I SAM-dependent DNA methyltransferase [Pararoseomonas baculiformis]